jgi:5-amino-6-(5-phosphoribosylamino)uracil reductase
MIDPTPAPAAPAADVALRLLGSVRRLDDDELPLLYAYPDVDPERQTTWVRANFISSIDGGATVAETSGGLGGPGDRALFGLLRALADIIVVGAGTVRVENYAGAHLSVTHRQHRRARGQSEVPRLAIVTESGHLDRDLPVFTQTEVQPLVLTCTASAAALRHRLAGLVDPADVVDCSDGDPDRVDEAAVLAAVSAPGRHRVLTEGGPTLLSSFIARDLLDELCLTVAPYVVGGQARRIATGPEQVRTPMRCAHVLTDDAGYLYTRYVKDV